MLCQTDFFIGEKIRTEKRQTDSVCSFLRFSVVTDSARISLPDPVFFCFLCFLAEHADFQKAEAELLLFTFFQISADPSFDVFWSGLHFFSLSDLWIK